MDELCEHDDDPNTCPPCRRKAGKDTSLAVEPPTYGRIFEAKFYGFCRTCERGIEPGQSVRFKMQGGDDQVVHEECD